MPITINGTGSVTGLSVGGLPDGTVLQGDLAPNVAGNGPCFSATQAGATQTINATVWTKLVQTVEEFDTASAYDVTANARFQPLVAGYYQFNGQMQMNGSTSGVSIGLYKNGSSAKGGDYLPTTLSTPSVTVNALLYLNGSTDYVELWGYSGSTMAIASAFFQGFLVRAA